MEHLSLEDREKCIHYVSDFVKENEQPEAEPPAKKQRISKCYKEVPTPQTSEIDRYAAHAFALHDLEQDILDFWRSYEREFPNLAKLAKRTLAIMPTSAPSERVFSLAGHVASSRRTSLKSGSVDDILLLNCQKKHKA